MRDDLVRLAVSRQRKYQLRMRRSGRCTVCGKPVDSESRSHCLKHLILARERKRRMRAYQSRSPINSEAPLARNGEGAKLSALPPSPVHFAYQGGGFEATASTSICGVLTSLGLSTRLQTFLTTLTWLCPINCASTDGWLTLTLAEKQSRWKVIRSADVRASLRLIPVSGEIPPVLRSAAKCFLR